MIVASVLRRGKDYGEKQAKLLHNQLTEYNNVCLTDITHPIENVNTAPLAYNYQGWWAKINLFNPDHPIIGDQDIFYIDIDTLIVGDLDIFFNQPTFTALTDFYHIGEQNPAMASGVMFIPAHQKEVVWKRWYGNEKKVMATKRPMPYHGDQGFISKCFEQEGIEVPRWCDLYPNKIISYKKDVAAQGMRGYNKKRSTGNGKIPYGARIVCFHGQPRPWDVNCGNLLD